MFIELFTKTAACIFSLIIAAKMIEFVVLKLASKSQSGDGQ